MASRLQSYSNQLIKSLKAWPLKYWRASFWHKLVSLIVLIVVLIVLVMYGIAQWYINSEDHKPLQLGVSFIPDYAQSLGVNPEQNMDALINIGVRQFRLVSYWSDMEPTPGHYEFSQLDWQFQKAEAAHAKIILSLGLRQP